MVSIWYLSAPPISPSFAQLLHTRAGADREAGCVVNMVVAVASVGRRLQLRRLAPTGIRRLLGVTVLKQKFRGRCCENSARSAPNESAAGDHVVAFLELGFDDRRARVDQACASWFARRHNSIVRRLFRRRRRSRTRQQQIRSGACIVSSLVIAALVLREAYRTRASVYMCSRAHRLFGDYTNLIPQPWAAEVAGTYPNPGHRCWPEPVPVPECR